MILEIMLLLSKNLQQVIQSQIEELGFILWGIEVIPRQYSYLARVYIDKRGQSPLGVEDCALVNRALRASLQDENLQLEISSPGLARKFFAAYQYKDYIGDKVKIRTKKLLDGRKNYSGILEGCDDECLLLRVDGEARKFLHADIASGQLELDYNQIFKQV